VGTAGQTKPVVNACSDWEDVLRDQLPQSQLSGLASAAALRLPGPVGMDPPCEGRQREAARGLRPPGAGAAQDAAADGVAFPLSTTHYIETSKITNPRQRLDLARTMACISHCRTLRARKVQLRHQMLHAMHLTFRRPMFRPQPPEILGTGVRWAFEGEPGPMILRGPDGIVDPATIEGMPELFRKANQFTEMMILAGPGDAEIGHLRGPLRLLA
jgi:hypothetical protein